MGIFSKYYFSFQTQNNSNLGLENFLHTTQNKVMKKTRNFPTPILLLLMVIAWGALPLVSAHAQASFIMPVPDSETGGGEEKKKDESQQQVSDVENEASVASEAESDIEQESTPQPATVREEAKPEPKSSNSRVNSFNFLFEMLYHFNLIDVSKADASPDPANERVAVFKSGTILVSN